MSMRMKFLVAPACLLGAAISALTGCEDATAKQQAEAQRVILLASQDFRAATTRPYQLSLDTEAAKLRAELDAVVRTLGQAPDGTSAQQAAKSLLTASALRELAGLDLAGIDDIRMRHRNERRLARGLLEQLMRLEAIAAAREAVSTEEQRRALRRDREAAETALRTLAQAIKQLEAPIEELTEQNQRDAAEAARLREEASNLIRRAVDLGYSEGFESHEQGVARRREADRLEYQIAHRELELDLELEPQHAQATTQVEHLQQMVESIRGLLQTFDEMDQSRQSHIARLRGEIDTTRAQLADALRAINASAGGELKDLYEAAAERLDRAARQAQQAASRLSSNQKPTARLAEARNFELLGRLHADQARSAMDHMLLLNAAVASGAMSNAQAYQVEAQTLLATHGELVEKAKEAYAAAEQALGQVSGAGSEAYRINIQRAVASLSGEAVDWSAPENEMPSDMPGMEGISDLNMDGDAQSLLVILESMDFDAILAVSGMADQIPAEMLPAARKAFQQAIASLRTRIESGEITTAEELTQELMLEMQSQMIQQMGGGK